MIAPIKRHIWLRLPPDLPRWSLVLTLAAVAIGVVLRLTQYIANSSLWLDELALVNNLAERSTWSLLTEPLSYTQVAPPGYVILEKIVYELAGPNDYALRAYSLLTGIAALVVAFMVALQLGLRLSAWVAPMLLALSGTLIFQSAQVKPYAGDAFLALSTVAVTLPLYSGNAGRGRAAALGAVTPWFSFPAAFVLAGCGAVLLMSAKRRRFLGVVVVWSVSATLAITYATTLVSSDTATTMGTLWSRNSTGYPPSFAGAVPWALAQLRAHLWSDVGLRGVSVWLGVVALGAVALWRRNRHAFGLLAVPVCVAVVAAALQRYPLGNRLSLWIPAFLILFLASAVEFGAHLLRRVRRPAVAAAAVGCAVVAFPTTSLFSSPPPYRVDHVKPVFAAIAAQRQPNDWLFVYPGAWHAYRYYGARTGIASERVIVGSCPRRSEREALVPLDPVRGESRVWVLFAHVSFTKDRRVLLSYLDYIGTRRLSVQYPTPYVDGSSSVDAHLYDLSDSDKLRRATANTFTLALDDSPNEHLTCLFGMVPHDAGGR